MTLAPSNVRRWIICGICSLLLYIGIQKGLSVISDARGAQELHRIRMSDIATHIYEVVVRHETKEFDIRSDKRYAQYIHSDGIVLYYKIVSVSQGSAEIGILLSGEILYAFGIELSRNTVLVTKSDLSFYTSKIGEFQNGITHDLLIEYLLSEKWRATKY